MCGDGSRKAVAEGEGEDTEMMERNAADVVWMRFGGANVSNCGICE